MGGVEHAADAVLLARPFAQQLPTGGESQERQRWVRGGRVSMVSPVIERVIECCMKNHHENRVDLARWAFSTNTSGMVPSLR